MATRTTAATAVTTTVRGREQMDSATSRRIVDIDGAAEHLTVSVRYVRTLVADRRLPHLKVGKYVRFDLNDLDEWLDDCRRAAS
jgi:excisionase family DNA binding protein